MRWQAALSWIVCGFGLLAPVGYLYRWLPEKLQQAQDAARPELVRVVAIAAISSGVYVLVAGSAWVVRKEQRRSTVLAVVAVLVLAPGLVGWAYSAGVTREAEQSACLFVITGVQLLVWLGGSLVSGGGGGSQ